MDANQSSYSQKIINQEDKENQENSKQSQVLLQSYISQSLIDDVEEEKDIINNGDISIEDSLMMDVEQHSGRVQGFQQSQRVAIQYQIKSEEDENDEISPKIDKSQNKNQQFSQQLEQNGSSIIKDIYSENQINSDKSLVNLPYLNKLENNDSDSQLINLNLQEDGLIDKSNKNLAQSRLIAMSSMLNSQLDPIKEVASPIKNQQDIQASPARKQLSIIDEDPYFQSIYNNQDEEIYDSPIHGSAKKNKEPKTQKSSPQKSNELNFNVGQNSNKNQQDIQQKSLNLPKNFGSQGFKRLRTMFQQNKFKSTETNKLSNQNQLGFARNIEYSQQKQQNLPQNLENLRKINRGGSMIPQNIIIPQNNLQSLNIVSQNSHNHYKNSPLMLKQQQNQSSKLNGNKLQTLQIQQNSFKLSLGSSSNQSPSILGSNRQDLSAQIKQSSQNKSGKRSQITSPLRKLSQKKTNNSLSQKWTKSPQNKKVNIQEQSNMVRLIDHNGKIIDIKYNTEDLQQNVQSLQHYQPDFGYQEQIEFGQEKHGWKFFLDLISRYRQKEKISNAINNMKEQKTKEQEENHLQKLKVQQQQQLSSTSNVSRKVVQAPREIKISNTPHDNWLLWNFRKGKESQKISQAEINMLKIKEELDNIKRIQYQDERWYTLYKRMIDPKSFNQKRLEQLPQNLRRRGAGVKLEDAPTVLNQRLRLLKYITFRTKKSIITLDEVDQLAQELSRPQKIFEDEGEDFQDRVKMLGGKNFPETLRELENVKRATEQQRDRLNRSDQSWYINKPETAQLLNISQRPSSQARQNLLNYLFELYKIIDTSDNISKSNQSSLRRSQQHQSFNNSIDQRRSLQQSDQKKHSSNGFSLENPDQNQQSSIDPQEAQKNANLRLLKTKKLIDILSLKDENAIDQFDIQKMKQRFEGSEFSCELEQLIDEYFNSRKPLQPSSQQQPRLQYSRISSSRVFNITDQSQPKSQFLKVKLKPLIALSNEFKIKISSQSQMNSPNIGSPNFRISSEFQKKKLSIEDNLLGFQSDYQENKFLSLRNRIKQRNLFKDSIDNSIDETNQYNYQSQSQKQNNRYFNQSQECLRYKAKTNRAFINSSEQQKKQNFINNSFIQTSIESIQQRSKIQSQQENSQYKVQINNRDPSLSNQEPAFDLNLYQDQQSDRKNKLVQIYSKNMKQTIDNLQNQQSYLNPLYKSNQSSLQSSPLQNDKHQQIIRPNRKQSENMIIDQQNISDYNYNIPLQNKSSDFNNRSHNNFQNQNNKFTKSGINSSRFQTIKLPHQKTKLQALRDKSNTRRQSSQPSNDSNSIVNIDIDDVNLINDYLFHDSKNNKNKEYSQKR